MSRGIKLGASGLTGGGSYDPNGRFICNTDNLQVGDIIRVRSLIDNEVYDTEVETIGDPIIFDVPGKGYYKVCLVQDIEGTPTEIGGIKTTLDVGQGYYVNVLNKTTLGGIQGILNAHQETELLSVGDEVNVLVGGDNIVFQIAHINPYNSHEVYFVAKNIYTTTEATVDYTTTTAGVRKVMQSFYNAIDNKDRRYIKQTTRKCNVTPKSGTNTGKNYDDYVFALGMKEITGGSVTTTEQIQLNLFTSQSNRIRTYQGSANFWWTADAYSNANVWGVNSNGNTNSYAKATIYGALPAFRLTADE